jgi:hypothetical protein
MGILAIFSKFFLLIFIGALVHMIVDYFDHFIWFSYYSGRIPSIILAPTILRRGRQVRNKSKRLGSKCLVCGFDKAWEVHFISSYGKVLLCPNHHFMVHRGIITNKELIALDNKKKTI